MTSTDKKIMKRLPVSKGYIISSIILGISILLTLIVLIQVLTKGHVNIFGYSVFRVVTPSMEPEMPVNTVLISKNTKVEDIQTNDIICFRSKELLIYDAIETHRVVDIITDENGKRALITKGDNNSSNDIYPVTNENIIGKVVWYYGEEGVFTDLLEFVTGKFGFIALIVFPILLISGIVLKSVGKSIKGTLDEALEELSRIEQSEKEDSKQEDETLPGYKTLTQNDLDEIYEKLKSELLKEPIDSEEATDTKDE